METWYQIVGNAVVSALPDHDAWRMRIDSANVMNVIVVNQIVPVHVLGPRAVAAEQYAGTSHLIDDVARNCVLLAV